MRNGNFSDPLPYLLYHFLVMVSSGMLLQSDLFRANALQSATLRLFKFDSTASFYPPSGLPAFFHLDDHWVFSRVHALPPLTDFILCNRGQSIKNIKFHNWVPWSVFLVMLTLIAQPLKHSDAKATRLLIPSLIQRSR